MIQAIFLLTLSFFSFYNLIFSCPSFQEGNQYYYQGDFTSALSSYKECLPSENFALHYNLAGAYFKLEKKGHAMHHYRIAQLISPENKNLNFNMELLSNQLIDEEDESMFPLSVGSADKRLLFLFFACLPLTLFLNLRSKLGKVPFMLCLMVFLGVLVWTLPSLNQTQLQGVVLPGKIELYSNQNLRSKVLGEVHEGKMLNIQREQGDWLLVQVQSNLKAWVLKKAIGLIQVEGK